MGIEKKFKCFCTQCGCEKLSRKRDIHKVCKSCNMKNIEQQYRHLKIKDIKPTQSEHGKKYRESKKNDNYYRLKLLLQQAEIRAKKKNIQCTLTIQDLFELIPKNMMCPVLNIPLFWGNSGKGNRNNSPSIDKINPNLGYTKDNVCIISWRANMLKSNATLDEMEAIYLYMRNF